MGQAYDMTTAYKAKEAEAMAEATNRTATHSADPAHRADLMRLSKLYRRVAEVWRSGKTTREEQRANQP